MDSLFTALPESLSELTDEQLDEHIAGYVATFAAIKKNDADTLGDRTATQIIEDSKAGKEAYAALKAEKVARAEAVASYDAQIAELTGDVEELADDAGDDGDDTDTDAGETADETGAIESAAGDTEDLAADTDTVEETETVAAAATPIRRPLPKPGRHAPAVNDGSERTIALLASAGQAEFVAGQPLDGAAQGLALGNALDRTVVSEGAQAKVIVAHADYSDLVPEGRHLRLNSRNEAKLQAAIPDALVAAAGPYCAPLTPYYTLMDISVADRPVRDALNGYVADRGGITYQPPPALAAITSAVGDVTSTQAGEGGTFATKSCQTIICPDIVSVQVDSIYGCITFGNLQSRSNPELIAHYNSLVRDAHARLAETKLLDSIKAGSTKVTGAAVNGAVNSLLGHYLELAAGIRSAQRMDPNARLRALAPNWVRDLLVLDIARSQFDRFAYQQNGVEALLDRFNLNISFYLDGSSDGGQVYAAQGAGAITAFPTTVETAMFPEGGWLFLDAGTLDLGVYRDSVLNAQNLAQMFFETFEAASLMSPVSYWITSTVCPNGAVAAPGTALVC